MTLRKIIIIAGPNGAGKTSFANAYLPVEENGIVFVNADEIARKLPGATLSDSQREFRAGRLMLERIEALTQAGSELLFETTLASLSYAQRIPKWQALGYTVALIYLRLPDAHASVQRVKRRVELGGHDIPERVIQRRFSKSLEYLEIRYKPIVDEWYIYDSIEGRFELTATWDEHETKA